MQKPVLQIRIRRIRMFLGLLDPDPLVRGVPTVLWLFFDFLSLKNNVNVPSKSKNQAEFFKIIYFFVGVLKVSDENNRIRIRIRTKCHGSATLAVKCNVLHPRLPGNGAGESGQCGGGEARQLCGGHWARRRRAFRGRLRRSGGGILLLLHLWLRGLCVVSRPAWPCPRGWALNFRHSRNFNLWNKKNRPVGEFFKLPRILSSLFPLKSKAFARFYIYTK